MATIDEVVKTSVLHEFALPEWEARLPVRCLYIADEFYDWVDNTGELIDGSYAIGGRTRQEHLEQFLSDLRCAKRPRAGDLHRMLPTKHGIWKLHPPGLRLYGWACAEETLVVVGGALVEETKADKTLNDFKRDHVRQFIKTHNLGKHVLYGDPLAIFPPQT